MSRKPEGFNPLTHDLRADDPRSFRRKEEPTLPGSLAAPDNEPTQPDRVASKSVPPSERKTVELPLFVAPRQAAARRASDRETVQIPPDMRTTDLNLPPVEASKTSTLKLETPPPTKGEYSIFHKKSDRSKPDKGLVRKEVVNIHPFYEKVSGEAQLPPDTGRAVDDTLIEGRRKVTPDEPREKQEKRINNARQESDRLRRWEDRLYEQRQREIRASRSSENKTIPEIRIEDPVEESLGDTKESGTFFDRLLRRLGLK